MLHAVNFLVASIYEINFVVLFYYVPSVCDIFCWIYFRCCYFTHSVTTILQARAFSDCFYTRPSSAPLVSPIRSDDRQMTTRTANWSI